MDLQNALQQRAKVEAFQRKHRIGLLTLLFTDLVGSTKLKQDLGDQPAVALIQRHHASVREILERFKEGEEIGTAGDSFFIMFSKPSDAVQFSLRLQNRLRALARETGRPLLDRVGIHIGEVVVEERPDLPKSKDLYGLQVDICARVMSLAEGGDQILLTRSAFDNARQVLKGQEIEGLNELNGLNRLNGLHGLQWLNHGPYVLKGVEEPLEICEVGEVELAVLKAPADSEKVHRYVSPDSEPVAGWRPAVGQAVPGSQWILDEKLGEGGFGEVWLGRHGRLKEQRVFKFCFRADRVRALKREMTLFRVLKERVGEHPHIVRLLEVYLERPPFYLEEEYVSGRDLRSWCESQGGVEKLPWEQRLEIVAQVADGLAAAHAAGVIHRDVKPGNILVENPKSEIRNLKEIRNPNVHPVNPQLVVKLTDFGIGQVVSAEYLAGVTATGFTQTVLAGTSASRSGTHIYMAPELLAGRAASAKSDLYALGVVLYQLLVCDFTRPLTTDWARDIVDPLLQEDLQRCFAGRPEERFAGVAEFAKSLRSLSERRASRAAATKTAFDRGTAKVASIAVLPFVNMSTDPENEFLSDGIAEDLITALSRVPGLRVPGRTSCFAFKGKTDDLRKIGQMLSVETVLEGSVRKAGNRLRITAQLINVADGFHLWSERYDRDMTDVFAVQDEITQAIVENLKLKLRPAIFVKPPAQNIHAYELCLQGRFQCQKWTAEGLGLGLRLFQQALALDPNCALAHVGSSFVFLIISYFAGMPAREGLPKAKAAARRALELADSLAEGHFRLADCLIGYDWNPAEAEKEFKRALEIEPKNPEALRRYGLFLLETLRFEESYVQLNRSLELDPLSGDGNWFMACVLVLTKRFAEAMEIADRMIGMDPNFWAGHYCRGFACKLEGRPEEALASFERSFALDRGPMSLSVLILFCWEAGKVEEAMKYSEQFRTMARQQYMPAVWHVYVYAACDPPQAKVFLERAIEDRDTALVHLRSLARVFPCLQQFESTVAGLGL